MIQRKKSLDISAAENSHDTPILVFFENNRKKMSSATNFAWRFKGYNNKLHATVFNVAAQWIKLGKPVYLYNKSKRLN